MDNDNSAGFAALEQMIRTVRSLETIPQEASPKIAAALHALILTSSASQSTPEGEAWAPTKDGHAPLRNVGGHIKVESEPDRVVVTMSGHYVFHQRGTRSVAQNRASKKAGGARKASKSLSRSARMAEKKLARATAAASSRKTKKSRDRAAARVASLTKDLAGSRLRAASGAFHAEIATGAARSALGSGGLPARPMIPESMPARLAQETKRIFRERWEARFKGGS